MLTNVYFKARFYAMVCKQKVQDFMHNEKGEVNIIAIIVILAIALALAVIFRKQIIKLFDQIWDAIWGSAGESTKYDGKYQ